jgi:hypothetical protein
MKHARAEYEVKCRQRKETHQIRPSLPRAARCRKHRSRTRQHDMNRSIVSRYFACLAVRRGRRIAAQLTEVESSPLKPSNVSVS